MDVRKAQFRLARPQPGKTCAATKAIAMRGTIRKQFRRPLHIVLWPGILVSLHRTVQSRKALQAMQWGESGIASSSINADLLEPYTVYGYLTLKLYLLWT